MTHTGLYLFLENHHNYTNIYYRDRRGIVKIIVGLDAEEGFKKIYIEGFDASA